MDTTIALHTNLDPLEFSPLMRGMILSLQYAETNGGIGLTQSGALNRKFVHWAADQFNWPGYTSADLFIVNKVLNEPDMPPLWPVHALLKHFKLLRRYKGKLKSTKLGRTLADTPRDFFDLIAPVYLYQFNHAPYGELDEHFSSFWHVFLNVISLEAATGCTLGQLVKALYDREQSDRFDPDYSNARHDLLINVIRPLCWLGLLWEDREGLGFLEDGTLYKTPLWPACLRLESDNQIRHLRSV